ncbi:13698_t:CDS:1, partial [Funneliformis geosporum]
NNLESDEPFVTQIRAYNQILTFSSLGVNLDEKLANAKEGFTHSGFKENYIIRFVVLC